MAWGSGRGDEAGRGKGEVALGKGRGRGVSLDLAAGKGSFAAGNGSWAVGAGLLSVLAGLAAAGVCTGLVSSGAGASVALDAVGTAPQPFLGAGAGGAAKFWYAELVNSGWKDS